MTRKEQAATLSRLAAAQLAFQQAGAALEAWEPTPADPRGDLVTAAYDAARAALAAAQDEAALARRPRGYQCPRAAALVFANID